MYSIKYNYIIYYINIIKKKIHLPTFNLFLPTLYLFYLLYINFNRRY